MSKRFRELAKKAGYYVDPDFDIEFEVFAELIVQECADIARHTDMNGIQIAYIIKEHFGVEE